MSRTPDSQLTLMAVVKLHKIIPHDKHGITVWRAGKKYVHFSSKIKQARRKVVTRGIATHEIHLNGGNIKEAGRDTETPETECAAIYSKSTCVTTTPRKQFRFEWLLVHGIDTYEIITWAILGEGGNNPVVRKNKSNMVYLLRKLEDKCHKS